MDALYKGWHISSRLDKRYYIADLITEILSGGGSSRLYQSLVKEKKLFSNIECYHFGSIDNGLLAIEGKLVKGVKMEDAEKAVDEELEKMKRNVVSETELQKVKNKTESTIAFEDMSVMNRANSLAFYELLGDAELMNTELEKYACGNNGRYPERIKEYFQTRRTVVHYIIIQKMISDKGSKKSIDRTLRQK